MILPCPRLVGGEPCGADIRLDRIDEWDTNVHGYEIADNRGSIGACDHILTQEEADQLINEAESSAGYGYDDEPDF